MSICRYVAAEKSDREVVQMFKFLPGVQIRVGVGADCAESASEDITPAGPDDVRLQTLFLLHLWIII